MFKKPGLSFAPHKNILLLLQLLITHVVVLFGATTGSISTTETLLLYWVLTFSKFINFTIQTATARFVGTQNRKFTIIMYTLHSGSFTFFHLFALVSITGFSPFEANIWFYISSCIIFMNELVRFLLVYIKKEEYRKTSINEGLATFYPRIFVIQGTITIGSLLSNTFNMASILLVFLPLAAIVDYLLSVYERYWYIQKSLVNAERYDVPLLTEEISVSDEGHNLDVHSNLDLNKKKYVRGIITAAGEDLIISPVTKTPCVAYWYDLYLDNGETNVPCYFGFGFVPYQISGKEYVQFPLSKNKRPTIGMEMQHYGYLSQPYFKTLLEYTRSVPIQKLTIHRKKQNNHNGIKLKEKDNYSLVPKIIIELLKTRYSLQPGTYNYCNYELQDLRSGKLHENILLPGEEVSIVQL